MICPSCKHLNAPDNAFCGQCGKLLIKIKEPEKKSEEIPAKEFTPKQEELICNNMRMRILGQFQVECMDLFFKGKDFPDVSFQQVEIDNDTYHTNVVIKVQTLGKQPRYFRGLGVFAQNRVEECRKGALKKYHFWSDHPLTVNIIEGL